MKILFLLCGKTSEAWVSKGMDIYAGRIKNYVQYNEKVLPDLKNTSKISSGEIKIKEGKLILSEIEQTDFVVLLDENGTTYNSISFAAELQKIMNTGVKRIIFVIGGPYGFSPDVYARANTKISLSKMTFSHQIVRVIFLEQLYRAFTILNNEPYHHQ
ncbi:MAG: 23S rRNA (pseudouridine(1915)-N(3))-methyltransferase RlmH [Bacteroidales bacterium]|jgi:23S rRNA (pseudouridine1915-N3)-methyltransferase|nr:23S rRNA (pseudouridine(1915)-N(3))-methyltransferase RlmH [Bacteroidales bacterium]MDD2203836.1 23S rRNA (pseudouridine(1915)-N(3))-methyltransferase RlmH [Bacteroidales bacterium]MDD3152810.1 23S rRNA (pseudouridine(1915)-N(3))-methyltransferase RlmH [Bacteroidales bacterium]MDD3913148.1 23S rRNA (pseudouridine(1915)-N(3))-methyltransferase RlmH [Bacteroidales bacterium]MDD4633063.1 23S rRNA (pseudouridine(1915)-N(3))-methyltransferase RlmH [Bacteroidales bacterium]